MFSLSLPVPVQAMTENAGLDFFALSYFLVLLL